MGRPQGVCEPMSPTKHLTIAGPARTHSLCLWGLPGGGGEQAIRKQEMSEIISDCEKRFVGVQSGRAGVWRSGGLLGAGAL